MERREIVHNAYAVVGQLSKGYDGMMKNESLLGRLANRFFWQLRGPRYESFVRQAFQGLPEDFSGTLLEVPVGTGVLSLPHYRRMKSARIVCLDYSEQMLAQAMASPAARGLHQVEFARGDVGNLPYLDSSFDCVLSLNGLHAFPNKMAAFCETHRVLKKGGTFTGCCYIKGQTGSRISLSGRSACRWGSSRRPLIRQRASRSGCAACTGRSWSRGPGHLRDLSAGNEWGYDGVRGYLSASSLR